MATFESIFPTFLTLCGDLHTLLLSVAFALFITGILVTVHHRFSPKTLMHLLVAFSVDILARVPARLGQSPANLLQNSILSGLGIDPANVYQQYIQLLDINRDSSTPSSWWNVMSQLNTFTTDLIVSAVLLLVGALASLMMFWAYIFRTHPQSRLRAFALAHRVHGAAGVKQSAAATC